MGMRSAFVPGIAVTYYVPFTGQPDLLKCSPRSRSFSPPRAQVVGQELQLKFERDDADVAATKPDFEKELNRVREYLGWVANDLREFNASLPAKVRAGFAERRALLERARAGAQALGFPVRQGAPTKGNPGPPTVKAASPQGGPAPDATTYDVALSFAGEDREYVEQVAVLLRKAGLNPFYDGFEKAKLWGKNLVEHLANVYQHRSRFVVMFISKHYVEKAFPTHERRSAQARALVAKEEYILPARFDDTEVPGLLPTVGFADLRKLSPQQLADLILEKLGRRP